MLVLDQTGSKDSEEADKLSMYFEGLANWAS